jgi:hypothetical protein
VVRGPKTFFEVGYSPQSKCSPLRVEHRGQLLPAAKRGDSGTRHGGKDLRFTPIEGTDPREGYRPVYDPDRLCPRNCEGCPVELWVYPGDRLAVTIADAKRKRHRVPGEVLRFSATADGPVPPEARLTLRVRLGGEVLVERTITPEELGVTLEIPLGRAVGGGDGELALEFQATPDLPPALMRAGLLAATAG